MLDLRRLAVLREYAAQGTIARTAAALSFTPSAVSQQLAQLQREAGVELFRRSGRRLELTEAGLLLVTRAGDVLDHVERVEAELAAETGDVRGTVRVAAFQTAASALVLPAMGRLAEDHPSLTVQLVEEEAETSLPLLTRGVIDLAIAEEYDHAPRPHVPGLEREHLEPDEMLVALPRGHHAARGRGPVRLGDLAAEPWATAREDSAFADMFKRVCRSDGGFEPDIRHRANDLALLLDLVATRRALALVPALGQPGERAGVVTRSVAESRVTRALFVAVRSSDRARPATAAVIRALARPAPGRPRRGRRAAATR